MRAAGLGIIIALVAVLSGCGGAETQILGSRATIYSSLDELVADSDAIVIATVTAQTDRSINRAPGTASEVTGQLVVLQYGSAVVSSTAPVLRPHTTYLLFLSATEKPSEYFVTGASAGIYELTDNGFERRGIDPDVLPELISQDEAERLAS